MEGKILRILSENQIVDFIFIFWKISSSSVYKIANLKSK